MSAMKVHFQIAECSPLYQKKKDGLILEKSDWLIFEKANSIENYY